MLSNRGSRNYCGAGCSRLLALSRNNDWIYDLQLVLVEATGAGVISMLNTGNVLECAYVRSSLMKAPTMSKLRLPVTKMLCKCAGGYSKPEDSTCAMCQPAPETFRVLAYPSPVLAVQCSYSVIKLFL